MASNSNIRVAQLMRVEDNSVKVIKTINRPYVKQFSVLSKKSSTGLNPTLYVVKVESDTPQITPQSKVKCYCSCLDFRYRLAYCFDQNGALLTQPDFVLEPANETNPDCQIRSCKHINSALKFALKQNI